MKKNYIVNGKVTYPTADGAATTFTFTNSETGEMFTMATIDPAEAESITYGDTVTVEIKKQEEKEKEKEKEA